MVFEHITTKQAVEFIRSSEANIGATITVQHLLYNRNAMLVGGIRPHFYCLPILKRESHQKALIEAATSGEPHFFLGTDSAPHPQHAKECACGCAGCYTAHAAIELYTEIFEQAGALDRLEGFASLFGPDFYGLPRNQETITLQKKAWVAPPSYQFGQDQVAPLGGGETISWQLVR
jgi:dihydroorotase